VSEKLTVEGAGLDNGSDSEGRSGVQVYEGVLSGLERGLGVDGCWAFEGVGYESPADESDVMAVVGEALSEPDENGELVRAARKLVFGHPQVTHTSQVLLAMLVAYEQECGEDGDGVAEVQRVLREAARRVAIIEALTA
jgi:hypothetical protein